MIALGYPKWRVREVFMDHYFNWEYNSRDTSEGTWKWSREGGRAKMSMLYQGGRDQMLQIAWSTVQSPWEANLCLRALSKEAQRRWIIHGLCPPLARNYFQCCNVIPQWSLQFAYAWELWQWVGGLRMEEGRWGRSSYLPCPYEVGLILDMSDLRQVRPRGLERMQN